MIGSRHPRVRKIPAALLLLVCAILFLLTFAMGNPPSVDGSEPAWIEVMSWSFLHGAQWGRDIVYTFGPLAFLQPTASYVEGIYVPFAVGQVLLPLAFAVVIAMLFRRASLGMFGLFAVACICSVLLLPGDIAWALTLLYGVTVLIDRRGASVLAYYTPAAMLAVVFAVLALCKFTLAPLWAVGLAALIVSILLDRSPLRAVLTAAMFAAAIAGVWIACGQQLGNLPSFVSSSGAIAAGYGHAMGLHAPLLAEYAGIAVLGAFLAACVGTAWLARREGIGLLVATLAALSAALFWRAFYTRGDHWPFFFATFALLPFMLLRSASLPPDRRLSRSLIAIVLVSSFASLIASPTSELPALLWSKTRNGFVNLGRIRELGVLRSKQWRELAKSSELPRIRKIVGEARIDVVTNDQGPALLNGFNFAPRPVFQSHVAYTTELAQLNAAYFLGSKAPDFVMLKLDAMDHRLPTSEDGLALVALLQHYRPRLIERGFLLLQHDQAAASVAAPGPRHLLTQLGAELAIGPNDGPTRVAIRIELNAFGKLYTLAFREPALQMTIGTSDGRKLTYRLIRQSAEGGFILTPLVLSGVDWLRLYLALPLATAQSIRIDAETAWDRQLFNLPVEVTLHPTPILHEPLAGADRDISDSIYPGFNLLPDTMAESLVVVERGREVLFLHAPAKLAFLPRPGKYDVGAIFGIEDSALSEPSCKSADGIGASLALMHDGHELRLWYDELDPFHTEGDRGPQLLEARSIEVFSGDTIEYRVDPGRAGDTRCDWSYVRDFQFRRLGEGVSSAHPRDRPFADGFDLRTRYLHGYDAHGFH
jgi:hypothetical protein